jgi:hypothetical protein
MRRLLNPEAAAMRGVTGVMMIMAAAEGSRRRGGSYVNLPPRRRLDSSAGLPKVLNGELTGEDG